MTRKLSAAVVCWLLFAGVAMAELYPPVAEFTPAGRKQVSTAFLPSTVSGGATDLNHVTDCLDTSPRQGIVDLLA